MDPFFPEPGGYMLFFYDGWISVIRILVMIVLTYGALVLALRSTSKSLSELNAGQSICLLAMGVLSGFALLNMAVPILNFVLALYLLVAVFNLIGR